MQRTTTDRQTLPNEASGRQSQGSSITLPEPLAEGGPAPSPSGRREVVVCCEGFGAFPGGGWFVEVSFVEWNHGGYSVFVRTDEDCVEDQERASRVATVDKPLTWRRVLQTVRRNEWLRIADDTSKVRVEGLEPWQRDVIVDALLRDGISGDGRLAPFFLGLPDQDLQLLHDRLGGLCSAKARRLLSDLARAVRRAGLRKKSLEDIARLVGRDDPWDLTALTAAVQSACESLQRSQSQ